VVLSIGVRVVVDADKQVDRLGRRVVEGYRERLYAHPIGRLSCRPYDQFGPVDRFEIDLRRNSTGIDSGSGDSGEVGLGQSDSHCIGRITKMDDRLYLGL
jgi:hypothetical protein